MRIFLFLLFATASVSLVSASAQNGDIHFHGDLNAWRGESERQNQFFRGDTILFSGWSNAYQDWGGIIQTPNSTFEVQILDPDGVGILNDKFEADEKGNIFFEFELDQNAKFGRYELKTNILKDGFESYYVDYRYFFVMPHEDEFTPTQNYPLELWFEKSEVQFGVYENVFWKICPFPAQNELKEFADPTSHREVGKGELSFYIEYLNSNGERKTEGTSYGHESCDRVGQWNILADSAGKWTAHATARWFDGKKFYEIKSEPKDFVVKEPLFASKQISTIFSSSDYTEIRLLDWSPDGQDILLSYNQASADGIPYSRLATFDVDSKTITKLEIADSFFKEPYELIYGQFSPSGEQVYFSNLSDRKIYIFDTKQKTVADTGIQAVSFSADQRGNIFYAIEGQATSTEGNPEQHLFKFDTKTSTTQEITKDPDFWSFDVNADGTKILYRKTTDSGYGWAKRDLAVYDIGTKTTTIIPKVENADCGSQPIFAPNEELIIYHIQGCSKGWSGGIIGITDMNGNSEILVPPTNENPSYFVISPDGSQLVYRYPSYVNGTWTVGLYQMTLAKPVPEFGTISVLILIVSILSIVVFSKFSRLHL
ncbi:MAG: PEFG-CTERM sorting domain-containing protein [Thermoproteota archaeon]